MTGCRGIDTLMIIARLTSTGKNEYFTITHTGITPGQLFKISRHLVVANLERHSAHNFSEEWCRIYSVMHTLKKARIDSGTVWEYRYVDTSRMSIFLASFRCQICVACRRLRMTIYAVKTTMLWHIVASCHISEI